MENKIRKAEIIKVNIQKVRKEKFRKQEMIIKNQKYIQKIKEKKLEMTKWRKKSKSRLQVRN